VIPKDLINTLFPLFPTYLVILEDPIVPCLVLFDPHFYCLTFKNKINYKFEMEKKSLSPVVAVQS